MEVIVLGSSGAFRLPCLGCHCLNCEAARSDPRLRRTTTSLYLREGEDSILLDASPDLYHQALREGVEHLDGIFLTHGHRDHCLGLECLETLVRHERGGRPLPVFGPPEAIHAISVQFDFIMRHGLIQAVPLAPGIVREFCGFRLSPFHVCHYDLETYGYRVERGDASLVYLPDIKSLPGGESLATAPLPAAMMGADLFFIDGTFDDAVGASAGHITWQEGAALGARSGAGRTVLVHLGHRVDLAALRRATHERLLEGYDGQRFAL